LREGRRPASRSPLGALAIALVVASALLAAGCGGEHEEPSDDRLQDIADGLTQDLFVGSGLTGQRQIFHVPGSALTVAAPDGTRTFVSGTSRLASDTPVSADQVQPIGSNTKVVTAVLVMRLVEEGKLRVHERLPSIAARYRSDGAALARLVRRFRGKVEDVQLRELLDHTSGLADCLDTPGFFKAFARRPRASYSLAQLATYGLSEPPVFKPGASGKWNYSNTDYMLLGMVIEAVTGESVGQQMRALFREVGMDSAHYAPGVQAMDHQPLSGSLIDGYVPVPPGAGPPSVFNAFTHAPIAAANLSKPQGVELVSSNPSESGPTVQVSRAGPGRAKRVERRTGFRYRNVTHSYSQSIGQSAGGIVADTQDLALFWRALFDGELVSERTLMQMQRTVPTGENSKGVKTTWGFGFGRQQIAPGVLWEGSPRLTVWMHAGDIFGYASAAYYVPQEDLVVTNTINIWPTPIGDLGLLRDVLRAYSSS
jgi:CubicO group peptidase (beta-lactamase class C family)